MKMFFKLLATIMFGSLLFISCRKKDPPSVVSFLKTDKATLAENAAAGKDSFVVSANVTWTLKGLPAGFTSNINSGNSGDNKVVITYPINTTLTAINADIIVTPTSGTGVSPLRVSLTQNAAIQTLRSDSSVLNIKGLTGIPDSFNILTNTSYTISIGASANSWISVNATSGTNNKKIIVTTLQDNTTNVTRTGTITISPVSNSTITPVVITVNQKPLAELLWSKSYGGATTDQFNAVIKTDDGGSIATGYTYSSDGDGTGNHGNADVLVVKTDATGNTMWRQVFGGLGDDFGESLIATVGGYVIAGYTLSNGGDIPSNQGGYDMLVLKIDLSGTKQWVRTFGGQGDDRAYSIASTLDVDGYVIAGYTSSANGDISSNHGGYDMVVIKIDPDGTKKWAGTYGGQGGEFASSIVASTDGYVIAGSSNGPAGGDIPSNHGNDDIVVIKINPDGTKQWAVNYGGTNNDEAYSIAAASGGYVIAGRSRSSDGDITSNHGGYDLLVIKIDNDGKKQWIKNFGGAGDDEAGSIAVGPDGYVIGGYTNSTNGDITSNHGGYDMLVIKVDNNGNKQWVKNYGGAGDDGAFAIAAGTEGYFVGGYSNSTNGDLSSNLGTYDAWMIKVKE